MINPVENGTPYSVRDVARALGISRFTVYDLIKRGELPAYRVGNRLRIDAQALAAFKRTASTGEPAPGWRRAIMSPPRSLLQLIGEDGQTRELQLADLRALGPTTVTATRLGATTFAQHRFTGVSLHGLLTGQGLVRPVEAWRPSLSRYVLAVGADGHMVALTLGEIDPAYSNVPVLVAWERDGTALGAGEGPLLLVVPSDHRGGRYVRELAQLLVGDGAEAWAAYQEQARWAGMAGVAGPR